MGKLLVRSLERSLVGFVLRPGLTDAGFPAHSCRSNEFTRALQDSHSNLFVLVVGRTWIRFGVGGCGWPISMSAMRMGYVSLALWKIVPSLASAVLARISRNILQKMWIGPLFFGWGSLVLGVWLDLVVCR